MDLELNEAQVAFAEAILHAELIELNILQDWLDQLTKVPPDLGEALCEAKLLNEFELTNTLSKLLGVGKANDIELEMYAVPHPKIPRDVCVELLFVPLSEEDINPFPIAIANPFDEVGLQYITELLGGLELKISLAGASLLRHEITACYGTEEEWQQYLAEQGTIEGALNDLEPSMLSDEYLDELSHVDEDQEIITNDSKTNTEINPSNMRPSMIPEWSHLCPDGDKKVELLHRLLKS